MHLARLSRIFLYPVKSAAAIEVTTWDVDPFGLRHDRRWMVVDPAGRHITQRDHPRLALARPQLTETHLVLEAPAMPPLVLPLEPAGAVTHRVSVWNDLCDALWLGPGPAQWISQFLGAPRALVYMTDRTVRSADPEYAPPGTRVSFADAFPFLLISEESLAHLNTKVEQPLPMDRFRPNLVIAGGHPHIEDQLVRFRIESIDFRAVKACGRCVVTTTDQNTATRGLEPLRTLATYRRKDGEVLFGQNVVHGSTGRLTVGSPVLA